MRLFLPTLALFTLLGCPADKKADDTPRTQDKAVKTPHVQEAPKKAAKPPKKEAPKTSGAVFQGPNFTTVQPKGFIQRTIPGTPQGTLSLYRSRRQPKPDSFLSSIIFVPIVYPDPSARQLIQDPKLCQDTGAQMVAMIQQSQKDKIALTAARITDLPSGKACQTEIAASAHENPHDAINTVMQSTSGDFSVTCNIARGDASGRGACMEVLNQWKWTKPTP